MGLVGSPSCIDISRFSTDLGLNRSSHRNFFKTIWRIALAINDAAYDMVLFVKEISIHNA